MRRVFSLETLSFCTLPVVQGINQFSETGYVSVVKQNGVFMFLAR
jgi:hypothetical protein